MNSPFMPWVAIVALLSLLFYLFTGVNVARARAVHKVADPAMTGAPEFERAVRVQMNTLEWLPVYLVALWLFALYVEPRIGAAIGAVWVGGRVLYMRGYLRAAEQRSAGFFIQAIATFVLWMGALAGAAWRIVTPA
jgi:glutathione S-transferase